MNTKTVKPAPVKITKKQVDAALAAGQRHAQFLNKGVQKRLKKNQQKLMREQLLREQIYRKQAKERAALKNKILDSGKYHADKFRAGSTEQPTEVVEQLEGAELMSQNETIRMIHGDAMEAVAKVLNTDGYKLTHVPASAEEAAAALGDNGANMKHMRDAIALTDSGDYRYGLELGSKLTDMHGGRGVSVMIADHDSGSVAAAPIGGYEPNREEFSLRNLCPEIDPMEYYPNKITAPLVNPVVAEAIGLNALPIETTNKDDDAADDVSFSLPA